MSMAGGTPFWIKIEAAKYAQKIINERCAVKPGEEVLILTDTKTELEMSMSLASFSIYLVATEQLGLFKLTRGSRKFFALSGLVITVAWLSMYSAFALGKVSIVSALIGTNPLFALLLSLIFLRDTEKLNMRTALGCLSIVPGAMVITLF